VYAMWPFLGDFRALRPAAEWDMPNAQGGTTGLLHGGGVRGEVGQLPLENSAAFLFTGVRGRGILRSSFAGTCINRPSEAREWLL